MARQEIKLELLIGKRVYSLNGRAIGRIEEARAEVQNENAWVTEFLIGAYALFERLSAWEIGRTILGLFGSRIKSGYQVRWDQIDLSNPERPQLTCKMSQLSSIEQTD